MCGIVGLFLKDRSLEPQLGALLARMLDGASGGNFLVAQAYVADVTKPEDVAGKIVSLCLPSLTHTGRYYSYKTGTFMDFQAPA